MDQQKKLDFVMKMTKHALEHVQHFDQGGLAAPPGVDPEQYRRTVAPFSEPVSQGGTAQLAPTTDIDYRGAFLDSLGKSRQGYQQSQDLLGRQQALQGQQQGVLGGQQALIGQQQSLYGAQQGLANQFQDQANGVGANPAQAMLNQATGQNIAQQAALAAGTRGAGSNAGLIASQAAGQGANIQQQAAGQGATLQAQQRVAALGQLQQQQNNQLGNLQTQGQTYQGQNQTLQGQDQTLQGQLANIQGQQGIQGNLYGATANANNAQNNSAISNYGMAQGINAQLQLGNKQADNSLLGGILSGVAQGANTIFGKKAEGGIVLPDHLQSLAAIYHPHMAEGGEVESSPDLGVKSPDPVKVDLPKAPEKKDSGGGFDLFKTIGNIAVGIATGGALHPFEDGGKVPGKPKVDKDDYANDTVPTMLTPGEVVIDLNTLKDKGKLGKMARFVAENIERKKAGRKLG